MSEILPDNWSGDAITESGTTTSGDETISSEKDTNYTLSGNDIVLNLRQDQTSVLVPIRHHNDERNIIYYDNTDFKNVAITIDTSDQDWPVNYRFSQVVLPDGSSDGPFGRDTSYPLNQTWLYQFHFHESMMAGEPRSWNADINFEFSTDTLSGVVAH